VFNQTSCGKSELVSNRCNRSDRFIKIKSSWSLPLPFLQTTTDYLIGTTDVNLYWDTIEQKNNPETHEESELSEIPIEQLNKYKLSYKGHTLSKTKLMILLNCWKLH
jgi:hypothetical protein